MWIDDVRQWFKLSPIQLLTLTLFAEAGVEGRTGLQAVLNVIHNRTLYPTKYIDQDILNETGSRYHAVILKKWQFSCYNLGQDRRQTEQYTDPNTFDSAVRNTPLLSLASDVVKTYLNTGINDITGGANMYCYYTLTDTIAYWRTFATYRTQIGHHVFFAEPPYIYESFQKYHAGTYYTGTRYQEVEQLIVGTGAVGILGGV